MNQEPTDDEEEWRYTVEEVDELHERDKQQSKLQALREKDPEPGQPTVEGTIFFGLGIAATLWVFLLLIGVV